MLAINAADDERNPPETGVTDAALKRIKNAMLLLIPASTETRGHLTTGKRQILFAAIAGIAGDRAAADDVNRCFRTASISQARKQAYFLSMHPLPGSGLIAFDC